MKFFAPGTGTHFMRKKARGNRKAMKALASTGALASEDIEQPALSNDPALDSQSKMILHDLRALNSSLGSSGGMSNAEYKALLRREGRGR